MEGSRLVIGHRGASGHRPEHTASAFRLAFRLGADSVEPDLVATRDGVLVCRHDLELSRTTDIAERPALRRHRTTMEIDGQPVTGWFVHDLTLAELRTLRCRERWPRRRPGSAEYDGRHPVVTFTELRDLVADESARQGRPLQIHAELKHPEILASQGLPIVELLGEATQPGVTWMSFDDVVLRELAWRGARRVVQLTEDRPSGRSLAKTAEYASAVGVRRKVVLPRTTSPALFGRPSTFVAKAARRGLDVLVWTHRAENRHLPKVLRVGTDPDAHGDALTEAELLWRAGVVGIVSDHPEVASAARAAVAVSLAG